MKILYKLGRGRGPLLTEVHILEGWEFSNEDKIYCASSQKTIQEIIQSTT